MSSPEVSVVIPVYNERENIPQLQREIEAALAGRAFEIIFVDDGSTDGTAEAITPAPHVRLLRFEHNSGQSAAMLAGIHAARAPAIVTLDGDLQNDPADIPRLLAELDRGADLVCGWRRQRRDTWLRRVSSRVANAVRSRFVGDGVQDTGCSLKAMRAECRRALVPFHGVHRFIPALVKHAGFRVKEIPVHHRPRRHGQSKYGLSNRALRATLDMLGVRWLQSRAIRPELATETTTCGKSKLAQHVERVPRRHRAG